MYECTYKKLCKIRILKLYNIKSIMKFLLVLVVTSYAVVSFKALKSGMKYFLQVFKTQQIPTTITSHVTKNCQKIRTLSLKDLALIIF